MSCNKDRDHYDGWPTSNRNPRPDCLGIRNCLPAAGNRPASYWNARPASSESADNGPYHDIAAHVTDDALERQLFGRAGVAQGQRRRIEPDWAALARELKRPGVTMTILWEEYREAYPEGYGCRPTILRFCRRSSAFWIIWTRSFGFSGVCVTAARAGLPLIGYSRRAVRQARGRRNGSRT